MESASFALWEVIAAPPHTLPTITGMYIIYQRELFVWPLCVVPARVRMCVRMNMWLYLSLWMGECFCMWNAFVCVCLCMWRAILTCSSLHFGSPHMLHKQIKIQKTEASSPTLALLLFTLSTHTHTRRFLSITYTGDLSLQSMIPFKQLPPKPPHIYHHNFHIMYNRTCHTDTPTTCMHTSSHLPHMHPTPVTHAPHTFLTRTPTLPKHRGIM